MGIKFNLIFGKWKKKIKDCRLKHYSIDYSIQRDEKSREKNLCGEDWDHMS